MHYVKYLLNFPWTLLGIVNLLFCLPYRISFKRDACVVTGLTCGLVHIYAYRAKGVTFGNLVVVRKNEPDCILEHELVHVEQFMRQPFIHQFLYMKEFLLKGYWNNPYEVEAYTRSNSWPGDRELNNNIPSAKN